MRKSESDHRVAHFERARVLFAAGQSDLAAETYRALVDGLDRTHVFLALPDEFPLANLFLVPSRIELDRFVAHLTSTPTSPGRVGQAQGHDLYLLSPAAYPTDAAPAWRRPGSLRSRLALSCHRGGPAHPGMRTPHATLPREREIPPPPSPCRLTASHGPTNPVTDRIP